MATVGQSDERYPFPKNQPCVTSFGWWEGIKARLFGKKFDESHGPYRIICYWYKDKLYLMHYGSL